jgi:hypothetical protein
MPIQKVKGGYKWGESGKVYPTKAQAAKQARAAYASGYKGYQSGDVITEDEEVSPAVQAIRDADKKFKRDFAKHMIMSGILSNPQARQGFGMYKAFRDQGPMGLGKALGQRAGIEALFRKVGPWGMLLQNRGGPLGLGIMSSKRPMSSKIMQGLLDPRVSGRLKFAQAFPQIAGLGWLMNKIQPRIEGQRGILGQGLGPQLRNLFARISPIKSYEEKYGMGSAEEDMYPDIQPIEVTAQKRAREPRKPRVSEIADMIKQQDMYGGGIGERLAETGGDPSAFMSGLVPGAAQSTNQGLRALNFIRRMAKRKTPSKKDFYQPERKISSGGFSRR